MTIHQKLRRALTYATLFTLAAISPAFAQPTGEIELAVTQRPPKSMTSDVLVKYFSSALRARYRSDEDSPIGVAFRAWLITPDGRMVNECTSRSFELTPDRAVGSDRLSRGFEDCWPTHFEKESREVQLRALGSATLDGRPVNLGLWDSALGQWARKQTEKVDYFVAIVVFATDRNIAERVRTSPQVFGQSKYPPQQGIPALDGSNK